MLIDLFAGKDYRAKQKAQAVSSGTACFSFNDTYWRTWNSIPPQKPDKLGAWLGRVVRNIAYDLWKKNHRQKRYAGIEKLLNELEECYRLRQNLKSTLEKEGYSL